MNIENNPHSARDNLKSLTGIGKAYEDALNLCGITTYADLAQRNPDELVQLLLERAEKEIKSEEAEKWIHEAQQAVQQAENEAASSDETISEEEPEPLVVRKGTAPQEITIKIGGRDVTFTKSPDLFAVRQKQEGPLARRLMEATRIEAVAPESMEVYRAADAGRTESLIDELRESSASEVISHVYAQDSTPGGEAIPTGTMTIQFKPDVAKSKQEEILSAFGLEIVESLFYMPHGYTVRLTARSQENPLKIAAKLQTYPEVAVAEPDISVRAELQYAPNDDLYPQQWHLHNAGGEVGLTAGADVKAEGAWEITRGARNISICIIDDGFDLTHPEFSSPGKIIAPRDFGENDLDPNPVYGDDNHGTACAGVALAEENGRGVVGLAPEVALMPVRMSNWFSPETIANYFRYAIENHADIISCSWHAAVWNYPLPERVHAIIRYAATEGRSNKKGCVILFAAGNQGRPLDGKKDGEISVQGFALHPDVIAVGASTSMDEHASYSNCGSALTICAPSSSGGRLGWSIVTTDRRGLRGYTAGDYTRSFGGTSSSTPLAAGLAALILSVNPDLTAAEVKQIMVETSDQIDQANGRYVNGHSPLYGHGRINAQKAVERALDLSSVDVPPTDEQEDLEWFVSILDFSLSLSDTTSDLAMRNLLALVKFEVIADDVDVLSLPSYRTEIIVTNVYTGKSDIITYEENQLLPDVFEYISKLEFPFPVYGKYETECRVHLIKGNDEIASAAQQGRNLTII